MPQVRDYIDHLRGEQNKVAREVGANVERHYTIASNGFAAELTGRQAFELAGDRGVLLVQKDRASARSTPGTPPTSSA